MTEAAGDDQQQELNRTEATQSSIKCVYSLGREGPYNVDRLGVVREEVQDAPALLDVGFGVGAQAMHQIHKLDAVPDEEHLHN